ncbi:hypothetical protein LCGC14_2246370 [marine sediment metagenome]|uniref:Uncharacterized protein n=1 Tax=marine sediment metagenome TaxID=412755 RepID=A0A0F9FZ01_9ZZZZ
MADHYCEEHGVNFTRKEGKEGKPFWSHKQNGGWCNEPKQAETITTSPQSDNKPPETQKQGYNADGAARGMSVKEIGDMMRAGLLSKIFGETVARSLTVWYRGELLGITKINYDGKDLPKIQ